MAEQNNEQQQINIELSEEMAQGVYSNLVAINHSPTEFVLDFIQMMPGVPKAKVQSRVILTPEHAKRLLQALGENVARYEQNFGNVQTHEPPQVPLHFGGPTGQA
jgi:hypothetical protein